MRHGIPIALGYLSVSFGFGILAVNMGLTVAQAVGISVTNLTSAGQVMGVTVIAAGGSLCHQPEICTYGSVAVKKAGQQL